MPRVISPCSCSLFFLVEFGLWATWVFIPSPNFTWDPALYGETSRWNFPAERNISERGKILFTNYVGRWLTHSRGVRAPLRARVPLAGRDFDPYGGRPWQSEWISRRANQEDSASVYTTNCSIIRLSAYLARLSALPSIYLLIHLSFRISYLID